MKKTFYFWHWQAVTCWTVYMWPLDLMHLWNAIRSCVHLTETADWTHFHTVSSDRKDSRCLHWGDVHISCQEPSV